MVLSSRTEAKAAKEKAVGKKIVGSFTGTGSSEALDAGRSSFSVSLSGTWSGTVVVERSFDNESTWLEVDSFTSNQELVGDEGALRVRYRLRCSSYSSGTINYVLAV